MRGQGYDNAANMKVQHIGAKTRIHDINSRAAFVTCGCHSLNRYCISLDGKDHLSTHCKNLHEALQEDENTDTNRAQLDDELIILKLVSPSRQGSPTQCHFFSLGMHSTSFRLCEPLSQPWKIRATPASGQLSEESWREPKRLIEMSIEQHRNERAGKREIPERENLLTSCIVRHYSHIHHCPARSLEVGQVIQGKGIGKESVITFVKDPSQHSLGVISGNHGKPKSGWPGWELHQDPPKCESILLGLHSTSGSVKPVGSHGRSAQPLPLGSPLRRAGEYARVRRTHRTLSLNSAATGKHCWHPPTNPTITRHFTTPQLQVPTMISQHPASCSGCLDVFASAFINAIETLQQCNHQRNSVRPSGRLHDPEITNTSTFGTTCRLCLAPSRVTLSNNYSLHSPSTGVMLPNCDSGLPGLESHLKSLCNCEIETSDIKENPVQAVGHTPELNSRSLLRCWRHHSPPPLPLAGPFGIKGYVDEIIGSLITKPGTRSQCRRARSHDDDLWPMWSTTQRGYPKFFAASCITTAKVRHPTDAFLVKLGHCHICVSAVPWLPEKKSEFGAYTPTPSMKVEAPNFIAISSTEIG
ncbi:hypothetical protein PR048_022180 [Dryococelus australis]|uniref:Uncharacterized protein n=1 Tax=Dryococelus australis TaxID=614101 RepID=A0ABQ9H096_9NEOP|nr:hypothetical protein PR048_022180 [Dryococelus australis]